MKVPSWFKFDTKIAGIGALVIILVVILISFLPQVQPQNTALKARQLSKEYKQGFTGSCDKNVVLDTSKNGMFPYSTSPIDSLDQYEVDFVFQNEGDRELKKQQINRLSRQFPLDWSFYPPNSSKFQSEQAKYIEGFSTQSSAEDLNAPYKEIGDGNLVPPDTLEMEKEEQKILATYAPQKTADLTKYDLDDAQGLVAKIYQKKGMIPTVVSKGQNVFEVVSTRNVNEKIEYEDDLPDAPASSDPIAGVGEATIEVPAVATQTAAGLDPFYEPTTQTRSNRSDYQRWTPGLERMFAPTYPTKDWIKGDSYNGNTAYDSAVSQQSTTSPAMPASGWSGFPGASSTAVPHSSGSLGPSTAETSAQGAAAYSSMVGGH